MLFTDFFFLAYFLPVVLVLCRLAQGSRSGGGPVPTAVRLLIVAATLIFYGFENVWWIGIFIAVIVPPYVCAWYVDRSSADAPRRLAVAVGVTTCLLALVVFKYLNWFSTLWPALAPLRVAVAGPFGDGQRIELPPGISFYVFEAISFLVDIYRRRFPFPQRVIDYASFICLFPRFIAGPIVRYTDVRAQIQQWPGLQLNPGLRLFALGFALKMGFADQCAKFVPLAFGVGRPDAVQAWLGSLAYMFQLYFDFWGYSVMAMGLGLCLGFSFPDNFLSPYSARSITEFWRRWHVSLSNWLRDYLYIPLGGNRCSQARRYFNLLATMTLAGLWHGASPLFLCWGAYHGLLLALEKLGGLDQEPAPGWRAALRRAYCLLAVLLGWVAFRADNFAQALEVYRGMLGLHGWATQFNDVFLFQHAFAGLLALAGLAFCFGGERILLGARGLQERDFGPAGTALILLAFLAALLIRAGEDGVPFLYFQF